MANEKTTAVDSEFSTGTVPLSERRNLGSLVFTWIGYVFTVTIMSAGGQIASGASSFGQAMAAVYIGYAILFLIAISVVFYLPARKGKLGRLPGAVMAAMYVVYTAYLIMR